MKRELVGTSSPTVAAVQRRKVKRSRKSEGCAPIQAGALTRPKPLDIGALTCAKPLEVGSLTCAKPLEVGSLTGAETRMSPLRIIPQNGTGTKLKSTTCETSEVSSESVVDDDNGTGAVLLNVVKATYSQILAGETTKVPSRYHEQPLKASPTCLRGKRKRENGSERSRHVSWRETFERREFQSARSHRQAGSSVYPPRDMRRLNRKGDLKLPVVQAPNPFCECFGGICLAATCACYLSGIGCVLPGCNCSADGSCCTDEASKSPAESRYVYDLKKIQDFRQSKLRTLQSPLQSLPQRQAPQSLTACKSSDNNSVKDSSFECNTISDTPTTIEALQSTANNLVVITSDFQSKGMTSQKRVKKRHRRHTHSCDALTGNNEHDLPTEPSDQTPLPTLQPDSPPSSVGNESFRVLGTLDELFNAEHTAQPNGHTEHSDKRTDRLESIPSVISSPVDIT